MLQRKVICEECGEDYPHGWPHSCLVESVGSIATPWSAHDAANRHKRVAIPAADLWIVCWKYKDGRASGHGQPVDKGTAQVAIDEMNTKYTEIVHWMIQA